jgi:hypothetical protein
VHGWDVGQATGQGTPIPADLAHGLLAVARAVVGPDDRGGRFAPPRPVTSDPRPGSRLLAWTGRAPAGDTLDGTLDGPFGRVRAGWLTGQPDTNRGEPPARRGVAS